MSEEKTRKEHNLVKITIDQIYSARKRIQEEAAAKTKLAEVSILVQARDAIGKKPVYVLVAEPNDEHFDRCHSVEYTDILDHLIEIEIYHYFNSDHQEAARAKVRTLADRRPKQGEPLYFHLPKTDYGSYPYMIQCVSAEDFIKSVERTLRNKDDYLDSLSRLQLCRMG